MGTFGKGLRDYLVCILVVVLQVLPPEDPVFPSVDGL